MHLRRGSRGSRSGVAGSVLQVLVSPGRAALAVRPGQRYLGGQWLPVPKPSDCGPGFAGSRAAPAQVGPDVGFRVCDHLQPLRLSCKGAREVAEPRRSDERFVVPGRQKDAHCVISAGRFIYHSVFHHSNSLRLLCSDARLSPLWV